MVRKSTKTKDSTAAKPVKKPVKKAVAKPSAKPVAKAKAKTTAVKTPATKTEKAKKPQIRLAEKAKTTVKKTAPKPDSSKPTDEKPARRIAQTKKRITKQLILETLEKSLGVVSTACERLKISRSTFYGYMRDDEDFNKAVKELDEVTLDFAESSLHRQIMEGSTAATIFFLKTKGKKRGYVETSQHEHSGLEGGPIQTVTKVILPSNANDLANMDVESSGHPTE